MLQDDPGGSRTRDLRIKSPQTEADTGGTGNPGESENAVQGDRTEFSDDSGKVESSAAFPASEEKPKPGVPEIPLLLRQFVASEDSYRPALERPFTIEDNGAKFTAATNGHRLIVVPGDLGFGCTDGAPATGVVTLLRKAPDGPSVVFSIPALRGFLGATTPDNCPCCKGKTSWQCGKCNGTGETECTCDCGDQHDAECDECNGEGKLSCAHCTATSDYGGEIGVVKIGPAYFNRWVLIPAVRYLSGTAGRFVFGTDAEKPKLLVCDDGRLLLSPLRPQPIDGKMAEKYKNAPEFPLPALA